MTTCRGPECTEEAKAHGLCWGHLKQREFGRALCPLRPPISPSEGLLEAAESWVEADSDDDLAFKRARERVLASAETWMRSRGWRPPLIPRRPPCAAYVQLPLPLRTPTGIVASKAYQLGVQGRAMLTSVRAG